MNKNELLVAVSVSGTALLCTLLPMHVQPPDTYKVESRDRANVELRWLQAEETTLVQ